MKLSPVRSLLLAVLIWPALAFANLLSNAGFDTPEAGLLAPNYATANSGVGAGSYQSSSAAAWFLYNNQASATATELLASTAPGGNGYMLHLTTNGQYSGMGQAFVTQSLATLSVQVFVLSGQAWLAAYADSGNTLLSATTSSHTNQWETLSLSVGGGNPNMFILYSAPGSAVDFYADNAWADTTPPPAVPEPASVLLLAAGLAAVVGVRRAGRDKRSA